jgi:hypothetical protein
MKTNTKFASAAAILAGGMMFSGAASAAIIVNQDFDANTTGFGDFSTYNHSQTYYSGNDIYGNSSSEHYGWAPGTSGLNSTETVDLTTLHSVADIDAGNVALTASTWLAGYGDGDHGVLEVSFFTSSDGTGTATSSFMFNPGTGAAPDYWVGSADAAGAPDPSIANTTGNWSYFINTVGVAAGTRSVSVAWLGYRGGNPGTGGSNGNDAYADDILVQTDVVPESSVLTLGGLALLGLLRRRRS